MIILGQNIYNSLSHDPRLFMSRFSPSLPVFRLSLLYLPVLLLIISLCGCAAQSNSSTNRYYLVNNNKKRESSLGFSIKPPSGSGWLEKLSNDSLYYLKQTRTQEYSMYTKATEVHLADAYLEAGRFMQFVKKSKELSIDSGDYRNISTTYSSDTELSPLCVRYYQRYEDHGNKTLKPDEFIKIRKNGLMCMHPETLSDGVDMFYVESYLQSKASGHPSYREEGESFLSSLKFHPAANKRG